MARWDMLLVDAGEDNGILTQMEVSVLSGRRAVPLGLSKAHHDAIDVETLSKHLNYRHKGVKIEGSRYEHFLILFTTLAIGQFDAVVQHQALSLALNLICFHCYYYYFTYFFSLTSLSHCPKALWSVRS